MSEVEVNKAISQLLRGFSTRHRNIARIFENYYSRLTPIFELLDIDESTLSISRKALIGSYFTKEFSIESAAFYNPSIIEDPDQSELRPDEKRVIISFRATGEGHVSSVVFRSGVLDRDNELQMEPVGKMLAEAEVTNKTIYNKKDFIEKLNQMQNGENGLSAASLLGNLADSFSYEELIRCLGESEEPPSVVLDMLVSQMKWLASSYYELDFSIDSAISERVIFPNSPAEQKGIEDARFVKFTDDDGIVSYYATCTANDGAAIMPKLLCTSNFYHFNVLPMTGVIAQSKGMALFPRKINGKYAMLCRIDEVNRFISYSENISEWKVAKLIQRPRYPWELLQIGNAGSPIETTEGWLVITNAIGPMKKCVISASLFELDNPEIEIGRLSEPLILPNESEREGYVPNVVFSCGSIIHNEDLVIPYAMSDHSSTYATVNLKELLAEIKGNGTVERSISNLFKPGESVDNQDEMKVA